MRKQRLKPPPVSPGGSGGTGTNRAVYPDGRDDLERLRTGSSRLPLRASHPRCSLHRSAGRPMKPQPSRGWGASLVGLPGALRGEGAGRRRQAHRQQLIRARSESPGGFRMSPFLELRESGRSVRGCSRASRGRRMRRAGDEFLPPWVSRRPLRCDRRPGVKRPGKRRLRERRPPGRISVVLLPTSLPFLSRPLGWFCLSVFARNAGLGAALGAGMVGRRYPWVALGFAAVVSVII